MSQNIEGGFGVKDNALIHPTRNLIARNSPLEKLAIMEKVVEL